MHVEKLCYFAGQTDPAHALVKSVTMFKPDLLHLNMRIKTTFLRRSVDLCLLQRAFAGGATEQKFRVSLVEIILNDVVNAKKDSAGAIK